MLAPGPAFTRPRLPAARCLHLVRRNPILTRGELVDATGLSQPTITRATTALRDAGLIRERTDLTRSQGRGRPTVPLEAASNGWILAGVAIGETTRITLFDVLGRTLRTDEVPTRCAEHLIADIHRLLTGVPGRLASIGVVGPLGDALREHFEVPVTGSPVTPAILGSETQSASRGENTLVIYADETIGAAVSSGDEVHAVTVPHPDLVTAAAQLCEEHNAATLVIAGNAFRSPQRFAATLRTRVGRDVELRMIPSRAELVRAVTRAVAFDQLMRTPLQLA